MKQQCCVSICKNTEDDKFLRFYSLPYKDKEVLKEWIVRIGHPALYLIQENTEPNYKVCEIHFHYECKTDSGLHPKSLPTFYLPILKKTQLQTNCFLEPRLDLTAGLEAEDDHIKLQVETCQEYCSTCYRRGILYDIEKTVYNKKISVMSIMKCLVSDYDENTRNMSENVCLDCVKLSIVSYLMVKRMETAFKIFPFIFEPLRNDRLPKRIMNLTRPSKIDIKTILNDCELIISSKSRSKYYPNDNISQTSVFINARKLSVSNNLSEVTATLTDLSEMTNVSESRLMSNEFEVITTHSTDLSEIPSMSNVNTIIVQNTKNPSNSPIILNRSLTIQPTSNELTEITNTSKNDSEIITTPSKLWTASTETSKQIKNLSGVTKTPKQSTLLSKDTKIVKKLSNNENNSIRITDIVTEPIDHSIFAKPIILNGRANTSYSSGLCDNVYEYKYDVNEVTVIEKDTLNESIDLTQYAVDLPTKTDVKKTEKPLGIFNLTAEAELNDDLPKKSSNVKEKQIVEDKPFRCGVDNCDLTFDTFPAYMQHLKTFPHRKRLLQVKCKYCDVVSNGRRMNRLHMKNHTNNKRNVVRCDECDITYADAKPFYEHIQVVHDRTPPIPRGRQPYPITQCAKCGELFALSRKYNIHARRCHREVMECAICNMQFQSKNALVNHMACKRHFKNVEKVNLKKRATLKKEPSLRTFRKETELCPICGKIVKNYWLHKQIHAPKKLKCDLCNFITKYPVQLRRHKFRHSGYRPFLCTHCGKSYIHKDAFNRHAKEHEASKKAIECKFCEETFSTLYDCRVHAQDHGIPLDRKTVQCFYKRDPENPLTIQRKRRTVRKVTKYPKRVCSQCGRSFGNSWLLNIHVIERHDKVKDYFSCQYCNKKFDRYVKMYYHVNVDHIKHLTCDICGKSFGTSAMLKVHALSHTNDRPYKCVICPMKFKTKQNAMKHNVNVHIDSGPFLCEFCSKVFNSRHNFITHLRRHQERKRHPCNYCDKTFADYSSRWKHTRVIHNCKN